VGVTSIFGKFAVVTFQLNKEKDLHYVGAIFYFVGFFIYIVIQTVLVCRFRAIYRGEHGCSRPSLFTTFQVFLCLLTGVSLLIFIPFVAIDSLSSNNVGPGTELTIVVSQSFFMLTLMANYKTVDETDSVERHNIRCVDRHNPTYGSVTDV